MAHRLLEIGIMSAEELNDVRYVGKMHTFAVISMPPYVEYTTEVHKAGGVNPVWNETFTFAVPESKLHKRDAKMRVKIYTLTSTTGKRFVGEAIIPLSDIVQSEEMGSIMEKQYKSFPVKNFDGSVQGELHMAFLLGEKVMLDTSDGEHRPYPSASTDPDYAYTEPTPLPERPPSQYSSQFPVTRPPPSPTHIEPTFPYYAPVSARPLPGRISPNSVFAGPFGRVLLTELMSDSQDDRGYLDN